MADAASYEEFGLFHENAQEYGLTWSGPPDVRRVSVPVAADGRALERAGVGHH